MAEIIENLVSTIIPVYNRSVMLTEAVHSVLKQTYRPIEIIISDDGSTDETSEIGRNLARTYPNEIIYIKNDNRGAGPARESGRQMARGEFIQYLDSDDLFWPRKCEIQVKALREHPDCGVAYGYTRLVCEGEPPLDKPFKWTGRETEFLFPWLLVDRWWSTSNPLYRRSVCDTVGPWSNLRWGQDWELDARIGALRTKLVHCKEFVCDFRIHSGQRQTTPENQITPERLAVEKAIHEKVYYCALQAGVTAKAPEMQHFARWVFMTARWYGSLGMTKDAKECLILAMRAAGFPPHPDMVLYSVFARLFGWRLLAGISDYYEKVKRSPSKKTIPWSWSKYDS